MRLVVGLVVGCAIGTAVIATGMLATAVDAQPSPGSGVTGLRDVLHTPPLIAARGERVALRYAIVCQADERGQPCPIGGTVFVRTLGQRAYTPIALAAEEESTLSVQLGQALTNGSDIAYYAVIEDGLGGARTVPAGGAVAPHHLWATDDLPVIDLGEHVFGRPRIPDGRVLRAPWGSDTGALGLLTGRELARIGPSAFDVAPVGSVVVLDQVNDRLARYPRASGGATYVPIAFAGGEGDLAIGEDGAVHVLDHGPEAVVRSYASSGPLMGSVSVDAHAADMLRVGPAGPLVHGYPGDRWFPIRQGGRSLGLPEQAARSQTGLATAAGAEVVVHAGPREAIVALVRDDRVLDAWRITSKTELGEIQLAEPFAEGLLVVLRVRTESQAEFVALVLSHAGLGRSFSIDAVEWAESAALGRFRLDRNTLFQLRSAPVGAEVVTFDLGGAR